MTRWLSILLASSLLAAAGDPIFVAPTTNQLIAVAIPSALNPRVAAILGGYNITNGIRGGTFSLVPTNGLTLDLEDVFPSSLATKYWQRHFPKPALNITPTWTGLHTFEGGTIFRSTSGYDLPPSVLLSGYLKFNSAAAYRELGTITIGKENDTDGNDAGYWTIGTRPNGGSVTERLRVSSAGVVNIPNLTASKPVFTDGSKNLVSSDALVSSGNLTGIGNDYNLTGSFTNVVFTGGGANTLTITLPSAGTYLISYSVQWRGDAASSADLVSSQLWDETAGGALAKADMALSVTGNSYYFTSKTFVETFAVADVIYVQAKNSSANRGSIHNDSSICYLKLY